MIKLEKITKIYTSNDIEQIALDGVDLILPDKGFVVIYGASGCGKTTLLNILGGLDVQSSGKIIFNGRDTSKFTTKDWDSFRNQEVGFIFQHYYLLPHLNVYDNIAVTLQMCNETDELEDRINAALSEVDILNLRKRYPKNMSGGQQQRVAIARALVANPSIILADEPTGALDKKNAIVVMENLKKVSENHLVVMVTHNEKLAEQYADRLIEISYGKIKSDSAPIETEVVADNNESLRKVHLPLKTELSWSARNVVKKKSRSIPIMAASAIGLAAVGVVLSMTVGISDYTKKAQEASLGDYPVYISCYAKNSAEANEENLEEYPSGSEVIIEKSNYSETEHFISIQEDFMNYMAKMPAHYYTMKDSNSQINFNVIAKSDGGAYKKVSSTSRMTRIAPSSENFKFIIESYDVLSGRLPSGLNDLVLVVDTFNRVDMGVLESIGFDIEDDTLSFDKIIGKEYHIISNDDFYQLKHDAEKDVDKYVAVKASEYDELYETKSLLNLRVCGIIREKQNAYSSLYSPGLLYSPLLTEYIKKQASLTNIVKKQIESHLDYDVFSGEPFEEKRSGTSILTPQYQYEANLYSLGLTDRITSIFYFTSTFEDRINIINYFKKYKAPDDSSIILKAKDYLEQVTSSFTNLVNTFSGIILVFAFVSILIAAVLTAILTYISVLERRKEIGLLRSLGARRIDISMMFLTESFIIGLVAAVVACGLIAALLPLTGKIVISLIGEYGPKAIKPTLKDIASFQWWILPVVIAGSITLSGLSALFPAIVAGKKKPADSLRE